MNEHVRDNLLALKTPPEGLTTFDEGADFTTTATAFADVDDTEGGGKHTITIAGTQVLCFLTATCKTTSGSDIFWNVSVDGSDYFADDGLCTNLTGASSDVYLMSWVALLTGLSAGQHVFRLRWKVNSGTATMYAGAGTANLDVHPQFYVGEWR